MPLVIAGEHFVGPFRSPAMLEQRPGVYLVLRMDGVEYEVLNLGAASRVQQALSELQHKLNLELEEGETSLAFAAHYTDNNSSSRRRELLGKLAEHLALEPDPD